jgi:hypothetical protein
VRVRHISTGKYDVFFSVPVSACGRVATLGRPTGLLNNGTGFTPTPGEISTWTELVDETGSFTENAIGVGTFDSSGSPADREFHLAVFC